MRIRDAFTIGMKRQIGVIKDMDKTPILNLGACQQDIHNAIPLDLPDWDAETMPIPCRTESINNIHAHHFFEHIRNVEGVLKECERVLVPGGLLLITVPWYNCQMSHQCSTHVNHFSANIWKYTLGKGDSYQVGSHDWKFKINFNMLMAIKEENIAIITQLEKIKKSHFRHPMVARY